MDEARRELAARLLAVMDRKDHWAWGAFARGEVPLGRLAAHFRAEWAVYVRDFPVMLGRVLGHGPPDDVRRALAANLYEEQTGGISRSAPHPELFLRMMEGCGYSRADFEHVALGPAARRYRDFLDAASWGAPWIVGCAVLTIFVEGSVQERAELAGGHGRATDDAAVEAAVRAHPLVRVHGVDPAALELTRVHKRVEGGHREDAWSMVLRHCESADEARVVEALEQALALWQRYRDEVADACGVVRS